MSAENCKHKPSPNEPEEDCLCQAKSVNATSQISNIQLKTFLSLQPLTYTSRSLCCQLIHIASSHMNVKYHEGVPSVARVIM